MGANDFYSSVRSVPTLCSLWLNFFEFFTTKDTKKAQRTQRKDLSFYPLSNSAIGFLPA
jgi:hypothetical protein